VNGGDLAGLILAGIVAAVIVLSKWADVFRAKWTHEHKQEENEDKS
jgi:hypothetical protein